MIILHCLIRDIITKLSSSEILKLDKRYECVNKVEIITMVLNTMHNKAKIESSSFSILYTNTNSKLSITNLLKKIKIFVR